MEVIIKEWASRYVHIDLCFAKMDKTMEMCHYVCNDDPLRSTSKIKNDVLDFSLMTSLSLLM